MKKPAKGKGYTVRIKGRKCLAASILEKQVEAAQMQFEELQRQNELLRVKEAMQLGALAGWEALLQQLAAVPDPTATDEERAKKLVSAAMLDMQALKLQQELRPADAIDSATTTTPTPAAAPSPACATSHPRSATGNVLQASNNPNISSTSSSGRASSSSAAASSSSPSSSSASSSSLAVGSLPEASVRLPHIMAMLDAQEIPAIKQLTLAEMAGRVRCVLDKVRAAWQQAKDPMTDGGVVLAMRDYAKVVVGHSIANNEQHTLLCTLNLDTLQPESPSEDHIASIVKALQLQPQQEQRICMAFHTNSQSEAQLLKQQQKILEQLQALLAPVALPAAAGKSASGTHPARQAGAGTSQGATVADSTGAATTPGAVASPGGTEGHSVRDKAAALLAVVSGGQQGLSPGDLAWLTKAGVDAGSNPQLTQELAAAGCLSVQDATSAEALLAQLSKLVFQQQQQSRSLIMMWTNLLTPEQQAAAVIAAYPYALHQARVCAKIAAMSAADTQP